MRDSQIANNLGTEPTALLVALDGSAV